MKRLLLFDVDGTLLDAAGAGRAAIEGALRDTFGTTGPIDEFPFAGRTDPEIARGLLRAAGLADEAIDAGFPRLWRAYAVRLEAALEERRGRVLAGPGVPELLRRLAEAGSFALGLLTGNIEEGAWRKLRACRLDGAFAFGAFGSDSERRDELPAIALERARAVTGVRFDPGETVVIGDTPLDIGCARAVGARALAVGTGGYSVSELAAHGPDWVLPSLADAESVVGLLAA